MPPDAAEGLGQAPKKDGYARCTKLHGVIRVGDIIKEDHRVVLGSVETVVGERANRATDVFLIRFPGDSSFIQESDEMERRFLVIDARKVIVEDPKIGARFQPHIVWFTWVNTARGMRNGME